MISVIIPTLNAEAGLQHTLAALVPAAVDGLVKEVIIVDAGSNDRTADIVDQAGARLVSRSGGRGYQLDAGARRARFAWLLFLHADTALEPGWERAASKFMEAVDAGTRPPAAAAFRFALDDRGIRPRVLEKLVAARCALLRLPYGDQGLLITRQLYDEIGGYRPYPLMEDVDIVRRLGRRRAVVLEARAVTSAQRYSREGYVHRSARNVACLVLYFLGVRTHMLRRIYEREPEDRPERIKSP
jgi:rSAM/selenodomain-associated transferase 2